MERSEPKQLRPGLWETINERYPGSMVRKTDPVPLARLRQPLSQSRLCFVSSSGVQLKGSLPFDNAHPIGDFSFRPVPSTATAAGLEIHQIKYPTHGALEDINVLYPLDRLRELAADGTVGALTDNYFSFIGYNMDPERFERETAENIASAVQAEKADAVLLAPA